MWCTPAAFYQGREAMTTHRILVEQADRVWRVWQANASLGSSRSPSARTIIGAGAKLATQAV